MFFFANYFEYAKHLFKILPLKTLRDLFKSNECCEDSCIGLVAFLCFFFRKKS